MPEQVWYRSLYWRVAFGFVALLASLLVLQGLVFLWMSGNMADLFPSRSPAQFASSMASDIAGAMTESPDLDLREYITSRYSHSFRSFVVVMRDGTLVESERLTPPSTLARAARGRLFGPTGFGGRGGGAGNRFRDGRPGSDATPGTQPQGRDDFGRNAGRGFRGGGPDGRGGGGGAEYAHILQDGSVEGIVAVPSLAPPLSIALRDLGPTLGVVALALLVTGTAVAAFVIFGPTRRRLGHLQQAVRSVGAGDFAARAPVSGGDEVTALSRAFNDMAAQLEERTDALAMADRTRRQLFADVSHELMTPLAAIRGYVETLGMSNLRIDDSTRDRYLDIVSDEAERLERIIGDLLELARLEGGGGGLRNESVSVAQLLERIQHRHAPVVSEKQIALSVHQEPGCETVRGDQNRLEQALQNLVANAVRHTPTGGAVTVRAACHEDRVVLTVDDTGPGIPPEQLARIFDRFYKVDESRTGTTVPSGSGLGLSIVQAIVVRHGGSVAASNREGGGARFEIRLPAALSEPAVESNPT